MGFSSNDDSAFQLFQQEQKELLEQVGHALTALAKSSSTINIQRLRRYVRLLHQGAVQMEISAIAQRTTEFLQLLQPHITRPDEELSSHQFQHFTQLFQQLQAISIEQTEPLVDTPNPADSSSENQLSKTDSTVSSVLDFVDGIAEDTVAPDIRQLLLNHDIADAIAQIQGNLSQLSDPTVKTEITVQLDALLGWGEILDWPGLVCLVQSMLEGIDFHPDAITTILKVGVLGLKAQHQYAIEHSKQPDVDPTPNPLRTSSPSASNTLRFSTEQKFIWQSGATIFAIELTAIAETIMPKAHDYLQKNGAPFVRWNEHLLPLINANQLLTGEQRDRQTQDMQTILGPVLVIPQADTTIALEIEPEQFIRNSEFVVTPQNDHPDYCLGILSQGFQAPMMLIDVLVLINTRLPSLSAVEIPTAPPPHPEPQTPVSSTTRTSTTPHILVVDDSRIIRYLLQQMLEKSGYKVTLAQDGLEALSLLHPSIDLIVSDVEMPRLTGFELLSRCRKHPQWKSLPIIILSQCPTDQHDQLSRQFGADSYLPKPFDQSTLLDTIDALLVDYTS